MLSDNCIIFCWSSIVEIRIAGPVLAQKIGFYSFYDQTYNKPNVFGQPITVKLIFLPTNFKVMISFHRFELFFILTQVIESMILFEAFIKGSFLKECNHVASQKLLSKTQTKFWINIFFWNLYEMKVFLTVKCSRHMIRLLC